MTENTATGTPATVTPIRKTRVSAATRKANANAKPTAKTPAKVTPKTAAKAAPKKVVKKVVKPAGPTATAMKQEVSAAMIRAVADMIAKWPAKSAVPASLARDVAASLCNYFPGAAANWDSRLPAPSGAGRSRKTA